MLQKYTVVHCSRNILYILHWSQMHYTALLTKNSVLHCSKIILYCTAPKNIPYCTAYKIDYNAMLLKFTLVHCYWHIGNNILHCPWILLNSLTQLNSDFRWRNLYWIALKIYLKPLWPALKNLTQLWSAFKRPYTSLHCPLNVNSAVYYFTILCTILI